MSSQPSKGSPLRGSSCAAGTHSPLEAFLSGEGRIQCCRRRLENVAAFANAAPLAAVAAGCPAGAAGCPARGVAFPWLPLPAIGTGLRERRFICYAKHKYLHRQQQKARYSDVVTIHYKDLRECKEQYIKYKTDRLHKTKISASIYIVNHTNKLANKCAHMLYVL